MKIAGRSNYKPGPKDECGSPPYSVVVLTNAIEWYRHGLHIPRSEFVIWEPATGLTSRRLTGLVKGFNHLGYPVFHQPGVDFLTVDFDEVQETCYKVLGLKIRMIATNPPFSVSLKRRFINQCDAINTYSGIPWGLLMGTTTLVEKRNGHTMRGCSLHIPKGRICYNMPNKGWGTEEKPTKATFETNWYSKGLTDPYQIFYSDFDMSDHFDAMKRFYVQYSQVDQAGF